jgi:hypothetical protein
VSFQLDRQDLAAWNTATRAWTVYPGRYQVMVGSSSGDIREVGTFQRR